ncbi:phosphate signaling complex protein PhoU [Desulfurispira natronophila]|uniref:Phosphate-specific transport system accessory protein PhoU n=1 Tax=Desulfurispira natronophila TaxID=682562 RepID=A0A7W7Y2W7_9BACT|nr:phosphate signaling complex protein PhoU [Desulfurispira natronophila]MBB5021067.1 phosphate transport system protein [Desulfurispira natronophila]
MKDRDDAFLTLKNLVAQMSTHTVGMFENAIRALINRDTELARQVLSTDDQVNNLDLQIEEICIRILALYEPKGPDLRHILTISRIINDLERIGDHCTSICREVIHLNKVPQVKPYIDIPRMGDAAANMVRDAIDAYFRCDSDLALKVIKRDDTVDEYQAQIIRELLTYILEDVRKTQPVIWLIFITRRIERIADHASNIAEQVYYMETGTVIRHRKVVEPKETQGGSSEPDTAD